MSAVLPRAAPYAHGAGSVTRTMVWVMIALAPATGFGFWLFGWPAVLLFGVTCGAALLTEALMLALTRGPLAPRLLDGSALLTAWLLALSLPPWAPWWIGALGGCVAIALGKHVFGGLGQNLFNPAMVARVVLLVSFPVQMTLWVAPQPFGTEGAPALAQALRITADQNPLPDTMSRATALGHLKTEHSRGVPVDRASASLPAPADRVFGLEAGSLGETSLVLLAGGGLLLLALRLITWHIPLALLGTLATMAWVFNTIDPARFASPAVHLTSGAAVLGAFFIATDYVTSPVSRQGQLLFGAGIGALTWLIRSLGGYPEGLAFAVLIVNALVPLIDRGFRPRVFGRTLRGQPLAVKRRGVPS